MISNNYINGSEPWYACKEANEAIRDFDSATDEFTSILDTLVAQLSDVCDERDEAIEEKKILEQELRETKQLIYEDAVLAALIRIKLTIEDELKEFQERGLNVHEVENTARRNRDSGDGSSESADSEGSGESPAAEGRSVSDFV